MSLPVVVIPVNRLARAKARLAPLLTPEERRALASITFRTVVEAAREAGLPVRVVTPDPGELGGLLEENVHLMAEDPALSGLNAQVTRALEGMDAALVLHADLPLATPAAIRAVVEAAGQSAGIALVRSRDGGTNAMRLEPADAVPLAYGPGSFAAHEAAAWAAGLEVVEVDAPELALDLDTPDDLAALLATEAGRASPAGVYLVELRVEDRLARGS